jgi:hypothetical protein
MVALDGMTIDRMSSGKMILDEVSDIEMTTDKLFVDEMSVDCKSLHKMTG